MSMMLVVFHVQDPAGRPIGNAFLSTTGAPGPWQGLTNACGDFIATLTPAHYDLTVTASGFDARQLPADLAECGIITIGLEHGGSHPPGPSPSFPVERGALTRDGRTLRRDDGSVFDWRGATMFQLPTRFFRGEDITSQVLWMQQHGVNVARMFVAGVDWPGQIARLWDEPQFDQRLGDLFAILTSNGIRPQACVVTYGIDTATWSHVLQRVYDVASDHPMALAQVMNEPWAGNKGDPVAIANGVNRRGVLSSYGIAPFAPDYYIDPVTGGFQAGMPVLDLIDPHLPRDDAHAPRNSKDCFEMQGFYDRPTQSDEPRGIADYNKDGSGSRSNDPDLHISHHALARLLSLGSNVHSQFGLEGRAPNPDERISEAICTAITQAWAFLPADCQLGTYCRPQLGDFGLEIRAGDTFTADKAYGSILNGNVQYVVVPKPTDQWEARPINGWRVDSVGPRPYILRLTK